MLVAFCTLTEIIMIAIATFGSTGIDRCGSSKDSATIAIIGVMMLVAAVFAMGITISVSSGTTTIMMRITTTTTITPIATIIASTAPTS